MIAGGRPIRAALFAAALLGGCATTQTDSGRPATGDLRLVYPLAEAGGERIPYRLYVPSNWNAGRKWPLVVLFGYGGNVDRAFSDAGGSLQREAEQHGFVIAAPSGYNGKSDYGANLPLPASVGATGEAIKMASKSDSALAEIDVRNVIDSIAVRYRIDPSRMYLMGNSMGMVGALHFADAFAGRWCAISASSGPPWPNYPVERLRPMAGVRFFIGDSDDIAKRSDIENLVERAKHAGVDAQMRVISGGTHTGAWVVDVPQAFDFFSKISCPHRDFHKISTN